MPGKAAYIVRKKSRSQHPWVFSNEVLRVEGEPGPGDTVRVFDRSRFLGSGFYNPHSLIRIRLYSDEDEDLDEDLIARRIETALEKRRSLFPAEADFRLLFGESDQLPGLVVDKYGDHCCVQMYSVALDARRDCVVAALRRVLDPKCIFEKNDFRLRDLEGLPRREGALYGAPDANLIISESGARFHVDIMSGQKTGYYFDHRVTRQEVRGLAEGRTVLDVFSYTGSFSVNAALGGARSVLAVDASSVAMAMAGRNAQLNGVGDKCEFTVANAFTLLAELVRDGRKFDLVCLDPPAFIKAQREKQGGLRGYRQVNALAIRLLSERGILVSASCSHHLGWQDLLDVLIGAAQDVGRQFTIVKRLSQGPDHPVLLSMPESEYLRCFLLQVT